MNSSNRDLELLIMANTNAVLALIGLPEPSSDSLIEDIAAVMEYQARHLRGLVLMPDIRHLLGAPVNYSIVRDVYGI